MANTCPVLAAGVCGEVDGRADAEAAVFRGLSVGMGLAALQLVAGGRVPGGAPLVGPPAPPPQEEEEAESGP